MTIDSAVSGVGMTVGFGHEDGEQTGCGSKRRVRAARLLQARHPAEVGVMVGAPRQTVNRWRGVLEFDGLDALRTMSKGGCPAPLVAEELSRLQVALLEGPTAQDFGTPLCARKRVRPFTDR